jgi:hypothetical protein
LNTLLSMPMSVSAIRGTTMNGPALMAPGGAASAVDCGVATLLENSIAARIQEVFKDGMNTKSHKAAATVAAHRSGYSFALSVTSCRLEAKVHFG